MPAFIVNLTAATFDFYVSPTGSNSNPGTLASPWALTAINTKRATYASKRLGIIGDQGTYDCLALIGGTYNGLGLDFSTPAYDIGGGSPGSPTVVGSCDSSGHYAARLAKLNANMTDTNNTAVAPLIGSSTTNKGSGYITIQGLEVYNSNDRLISLGTSGVPRSADATAYQVLECYVHGVNSTTAGANSSGITVYACTVPVIQNNLVTNIVNSNSRNTAIETWTSNGASIKYNTIRMSNSGASGIYIKNSNQFSVEIAYNYIDMSASPSSGTAGICCWDLQGASAANLSSFHHNIILEPTANNGAAFVGSNVGVTNTSSVDTQKFFNNTVVGFNSTSGDMFTFGAASTLQSFNNIWTASGSGYRGHFSCNVSQPTLWDYNYYADFDFGLATDGSTAGPTLYTTQATFAAALPAGCVGKEAHSTVGSTTFVGGGHGNALDYKLSAGPVGKGSSDGTTSGAAVDCGAWGAGGGVVAPTQIGSVINGVYD